MYKKKKDRRSFNSLFFMLYKIFAQHTKQTHTHTMLLQIYQ